MPSATLTARVTGGTPQAGVLVGQTTFNALGPAVGTAETAVTTDRRANAVCRCADRAFFWVRQEVYRYDRPSDAWVLAFTLSGVPSADYSHTGLFPWLDQSAGDFGLCGMFRNAGGFMVGIRYDYNTDAWAESTATVFPASAAIAGWIGAMQRNTLYLSNNARVWAYNPLLNSTPSSATHGAGTSQHKPILVAGGNMWGTKHGPTGGAAGGVIVPGLLQLVGGTWALVSAFSDVHTSYHTRSRQEIYFHAGSVWTTHLNAAGNGYKLTEYPLATPASPVDRTSSHLPAVLQPAGGAPGTPIEWRLSQIVDNQETPGTGTVRLLFQSSASSTSTLIRVNPGTGLWELQGASDSAGDYSVPRVINGGSHRFYDIATEPLAALVTAVAPLAGGNVLTIRAFGDPLVLTHSAPVGAFALGDVVTGGTSGATAVITKINATIPSLELGLQNGIAFSASEGLTAAPSGATASTTAAPTGGTSTRTVKVRHNAEENTPLAQSDLGIPPGGLIAPSTLSVDDLGTVAADGGATEYKVSHLSAGDGVPPGANVHYWCEIA